MEERMEALLRPTANELALAPELGVLAALDATLATTAHQLIAENPDLYSLELAARGEIPATLTRKANSLFFRIGELRVKIREYRELAVNDDPPF
ncbi:hypothetical protein K0B90_08200 [bacterium]|nr:hypothetical protein [bacterium]